jgi:Protein of unknown function (DUF429)
VLLVIRVHDFPEGIAAPSGWSRAGKSRLAERQLATLGIHAYYTGEDPGDYPFYAWLRVGLQIYERLAVEYPLYRRGEVAEHAAEIFPHASAALLANSLPPRNEKEPFRREVLRDHRVAQEDLPTLDLVDAALATLTGVIVLDWPLKLSVGDPKEGVILDRSARFRSRRFTNAESQRWSPSGVPPVSRTPEGFGRKTRPGGEKCLEPGRRTHQSFVERRLGSFVSRVSRSGRSRRILGSRM